MRPIAVDLFAGAGGMSLGFEQAGFDVVAAVEIDPIHAAVHKYNFPKTAVLARSVVGLTATEIREFSGIGTRRVSVVFGGAPCQGFSLIGHRQIDDPRNQLAKDFIRLVCELDADYAVFENVKGLTVGTHKALLNDIVEEFKATGYDVVLPWNVLNAAHFGVPQSRERLFLLAHRRGLPAPAYPERLSDRVTVQDAIGDLPDAEEFDELSVSDAVVATLGSPSSYAAELRGLTNDCWHYGHMRSWDSLSLTSSMRSDHTEISRRRFAATKEGTIEPVSRLFKLSLTGLSNTLRAGTDSARGAFTSPRPIHPLYPRCVTVREMMRLHGYPDWFRMHSTKWHGARQVGNSVPPPLARAVAAQVIEAIGVTPSRPAEIVTLESENLLSMDMREASEFFEVARVIGRRDKKSGAVKRKQSEIEALRVAAE